LTQLAGSIARWTGEGGSRALSAGTYARQELDLLAVAALTVVSDELLADPSGLGEAEMLRDLLNACAEALDRAFLDVANTGTAGVEPASVTSTATPIVMTGASIADLNQALAQAIDQLVRAGSNLTSAAWVLHPGFAARMGLARESGGLAWPAVGALGGVLAGLPVLTSASQSTDADSDGSSSITLLDASQISYSDGETILRSSKNAAVTMSDAPAGNTITPTSAGTLTSMFQSDCTALMAQLRVNWAVRRPGAVQVITGARLEIGS
jgi:HK97 family phage major capsid protein